MKNIVNIILSTLFCIRCSSGDLPDSFRLETFRVLAIIANTPEVDPGQTVTLTPLLSDIQGGGRTITFSAQACIDPGVGFGATPTCDQDPFAVTIATDQTVSGLSAPNYTGLVTSTVDVTVPQSAIIFNQRTIQDQFNGINYLVVFRFDVSPTESVQAFKRILVSNRTLKHQNPTYTTPSILSDGTSLAALPAGEVNVNVDIDASSNESFEELQPGNSVTVKTEQMQTLWYISDGELFSRLTDNDDPTKFTPPAVIPTSHQVVIVAVTTDQRGGANAIVGFY